MKYLLNNINDWLGGSSKNIQNIKNLNTRSSTLFEKKICRQLRNFSNGFGAKQKFGTNEPFEILRIMNFYYLLTISPQ